MNLPICISPYISWALVFHGIDAPLHTDYGYSCYAQKDRCEVAEMAANQAFTADRTAPSHNAECVEQPAGNPYEVK